MQIASRRSPGGHAAANVRARRNGMHSSIEVMEVACGARRRVCACAHSLEGAEEWRGGEGDCFHLPTSLASDVNKRRQSQQALTH